MQRAFSNSGVIQSPGQRVAVFTNTPPLVGAEFEIVDTRGNVLNVAQAEHVGKNTTPGATQKYVVNAKVVA